MARHEDEYYIVLDLKICVILFVERCNTYVNIDVDVLLGFNGIDYLSLVPFECIINKYVDNQGLR